MSTVMTEQEVLTQALDRVLAQVNEADAEYREVHRQEQDAMRRLSKLSDEARRLRLALWALEGRDEGPAASGKANTANHERQMELRRADR